MGGYPPHGTVPGGFPRPGGAAAGGEVTTADGRREMRAHLEGGGERGGRVKSDGDLNLAKAKYCRTVYSDATDSGPVQGG